MPADQHTVDYTLNPLRGAFASKSMEEAENYYDTWATTYDSDVKNHDYNGPKYLGTLCEKYVKKSAVILSIGAGTGLETIELRRLGYTKIDGHDGSQKMLDKAKERGLFRQYICQMLEPDQKTPFKDEAYDAQVCLGCFIPGHLNAEHVPQLLTSLKIGGVFIIGTRQRFTTPSPEFNYDYDLDSKLNDLVDVGQIKILEKSTVEKYTEDWPGVFYVIQKLKLS